MSFFEGGAGPDVFLTSGSGGGPPAGVLPVQVLFLYNAAGLGADAIGDPRACICRRGATDLLVCSSLHNAVSKPRISDLDVAGLLFAPLRGQMPMWPVLLGCPTPMSSRPTTVFGILRGAAEDGLLRFTALRAMPAGCQRLFSRPSFVILQPVDVAIL